jgi:hypothetical protein
VHEQTPFSQNIFFAEYFFRKTLEKKSFDTKKGQRITEECGQQCDQKEFVKMTKMLAKNHSVFVRTYEQFALIRIF